MSKTRKKSYAHLFKPSYSVDDLISMYVVPADLSEKKSAVQKNNWKGVKLVKDRNFARTSETSAYNHIPLKERYE